MLILSKLSARMLGAVLWLSSWCVMDEQLVTGWSLNQLRLEPLSGDFESVNAQFPPGALTGGFGSMNGFPSSYSKHLSPWRLRRVCKQSPSCRLLRTAWANLSGKTWQLDPTNVDDVEDFSAVTRAWFEAKSHCWRSRSCHPRSDPRESQAKYTVGCEHLSRLVSSLLSGESRLWRSCINCLACQMWHTVCLFCLLYL